MKVGFTAVRASCIARWASLCFALPACSSSTTTSGQSAAARDRVFVSQAGSSTLLAVDAWSGETVARIEVGMLPHNIVVSPDRRTLYAALVGSQAIAEIDVATLSVRRTLLTAPVPERRADGSIIEAALRSGRRSPRVAVLAVTTKAEPSPSTPGTVHSGCCWRKTVDVSTSLICAHRD